MGEPEATIVTILLVIAMIAIFVDTVVAAINYLARKSYDRAIAAKVKEVSERYRETSNAYERDRAKLRGFIEEQAAVISKRGQEIIDLHYKVGERDRQIRELESRIQTLDETCRNLVGVLDESSTALMGLSLVQSGLHRIQNRAKKLSNEIVVANPDVGQDPDPDDDCPF